MNPWISAVFNYSWTLCVLAILPISGCISQTTDAEEPIRIFCDAELVQTTPTGESFVTDSLHFAGGQTQTKLTAHSGVASVLLYKGQEYGMTHKLNDLKEGERLVVSVWRKSKSGGGSLVTAAQPIHLSYLTTTTPVEAEENTGWELLELRFDVPYGVDSILFYTHNGSQDSVFFDDLEILRFPPKPVHSIDGITHLELEIDSASVVRMAELRATALKQGVITDKLKKEFDCVASIGDEHYPAELRFKGDWTDHLKSSKWSYRLKIAGGKALDRKRTISIQHPETRNFLEEWFLHHLFKNEGILTTSYDFVTVSVNGINKGIHAREEHFEKQLLESQNRREGVILKLDESLFWTIQSNASALNWGANPVPEIDAASILPFKAKKTTRSESLSKQFEAGRNLLQKMKSFSPQVEEYLDIDQYARYYAIQILARTSHGSRWHNQRWYANPVTLKLEPIAYDCASQNMDADPSSSAFDFLKPGKLNQDEYFAHFLFNDSAFCVRLKSHLDRMTKPEYLDGFMESIQPRLEANLALLQSEFPRYSFDPSFYKLTAQRIRKDLSDLDKWIAEKDGFQLAKHGYKEDVPLFVSECMVPEVFTNSVQKMAEYEVVNVAPHDLKIVGFNTSAIKKMTSLNTPVKIEAKGRNNRGTVSVNEAVKKLFYRYSGSDSLHSIAPFAWSAPESTTPRDQLTAFPLDHPSVKEADGQKIVLKSGLHKFESLYLFPSDVRVEILAGTEIHLANEAGMVLQGPVQMIGSEEMPIKIIGETKNNHGFTVLQSVENSSLENVVFENLNTLRKNGWTLTGAVNFYESDVSIVNSEFNSNNCEDALNIIRSDFDVSKCSFENVFGDAFDSDFCTGRLSETTFTTIGNDGIDFSGSTVDVTTCTFIKIGDKAVSGGEQSTLTATKLTVEGAEIGIASKDLSSVSVTDSELKGCNFGYVAYTKKPEYGGAKVEITDVRVSDTKTEYDIELKSSMILNGELIKGTEYSKVPKY